MINPNPYWRLQQINANPHAGRGEKVGWLLTEAEDAQRLKRLKRLGANGVADRKTYSRFRPAVLRLAKLFISPKMINDENLPWPEGRTFWPEGEIDRLGIDRIGDYPGVVCFSHVNIWDIPMSGMIYQPMVWVCKASFGKWRLIAPYFIRNGALPFCRKKDQILTKKKWVPVRFALWRIWRLQKTCYTIPEMMELAEEALARGAIVNMFPEGTRNHSHLIKEPAPGAALLCCRTGVSMTPVALLYGKRRLALGLRRQALAVVGTPIEPDDYSHLPERQAVAAMTGELERQVNEELQPEGRKVLGAL